jgi:hypothetical protein
MESMDDNITLFDEVNKEVIDGMNGKNQVIPIGLPRIGRWASLMKGTITLIFSTTGAGKSSFVDTIILNVCDYHVNNLQSMKPDFQLFSMERNPKMRLAKWISYYIFKNEGHVIEPATILSRDGETFSKEGYSLFIKQKEYFDYILNEYITVHAGAKTPNEIYKIMKDHFEEQGVYEETEVRGRKKKVYIPKDENTLICPIFDHGNLTKTTQTLPSKKMAQDKLVEMCQGFRDLENASPIWVAQVNRAISGATRLKDSEMELVLDDVKESGDIGDACDIAISLFDPVKYKQSSRTGYNPNDFVDNNGYNYFRSAMILKNSYGPDSIRFPLAFNGFCGIFRELPRKDNDPKSSHYMSEARYNSIVEDVKSKQYFLD